MNSRRSFLKVVIALPILACVKPPEEIVKPKPKPPLILTQSDHALDAISSIFNVERYPYETDEELRRRILTVRELM